MRKKLFLIMPLLFACSSSKPIQNVKITVPDGAPLLTSVKMQHDNDFDDGFHTLNWSVTANADTLVAELLQETPDIVVAPINVGAKMYSEGHKYRLAAVPVWGIMHIVTNQTLDASLSNPLQNLLGETIFAFSKSGTPGITLRSILTQYNIPHQETLDPNAAVPADKVNIYYLTDASDVKNAIAPGIAGINVKYALLAEPVATAISGATSGAYSAKINIQTLWTANNGGKMYPQAGLFFHERLLAKDKVFLKNFVELYEESTAWALTNPLEAGNIAKNDLDSTAIPNGTIVQNAVNAGRLPLNFVYSKDAKEAVSSYLEIVYNEFPTLVGNKIPDSKFYYEV